MLQGSKSLAHVMEFAQRRIELVPIRRICGFLLRIALAAAVEVHDEQNGDDAKSNERGDERGDEHGRATRRVSCNAVDRGLYVCSENVHDGE